MEIFLDVAEVIRQIRQEKFDNLTWSSEEEIFRRRPKFRSKLLEGYDILFSLAVQVKFKRSVFGTYLDFFNSQQEQDKELNENKLGITKWNIKSFTPVENLEFKENNNASDDLFSMLINAVKEMDCITWEFLYENLVSLRLVEYHITEIDVKLRDFRNLQVLVLCGNWIQDIPGKFLPRNLRFCELYANEVSHLRNMCKNTPTNLLHIGLGRNKLTNGDFNAHISRLTEFDKNLLTCGINTERNDSNFKRLEKCGKFDMLRTLDLSDNDIYELMYVLEPLKTLKMLSGLQLEGNPCATCMAYIDAVFTALPQLIYLDNTQVLKKDKTKEYSAEDLRNAALTFTCHRIVGLPAPPKEKGVVQSIHFEVTLPLLEEINLEPPEEPEEDEKVEKKGKGKAKAAKTPKSKSSKKGGKAQSPYQAPDEYEKEKKLRLINPAFKTQRMPWAKVLQFPEESLIVESPEKDLTAIRDTFRTSVNVKVIYLKVRPPEKPKKGKKGGKDKKGSKKSKSDKKKGKGGKGSKSDANKPKVIEKPKEPQETIMKKVTLANFYCDLHSVNWSDKTVDFYWAAHSKCSPKAIPVEGSLRAINYVEGKKGKKGKSDGDAKSSKSGKSGKSSKSGAKDDATIVVEKIPSKQFLPNIFTCQVGFGLKRSSPVL